MIERHVVDRSDGGVGTGMVLGVIFVLLAVVIALFFVFGGPSRFASSNGAPSQTNVNVPAQGSQPQSGPNVNIPRQIDVNVNQQPQNQAPAQQNAPAPAQQSAPAPAQQNAPAPGR